MQIDVLLSNLMRHDFNIKPFCLIDYYAFFFQIFIVILTIMAGVTTADLASHLAPTYKPAPVPTYKPAPVPSYKTPTYKPAPVPAYKQVPAYAYNPAPALVYRQAIAP